MTTTENDEPARAFKVMVDCCRKCPFMHIFAHSRWCHHPSLEGDYQNVNQAWEGDVSKNCPLVNSVTMISGPSIWNAKVDSRSSSTKPEPNSPEERQMLAQQLREAQEGEAETWALMLSHEGKIAKLEAEIKKLRDQLGHN